MALIDVDVFREALNDYIVAENCDGDYKDGLIEAGLMAMELPKFEQPQWISCAERLPNESGRYLVCCKADPIFRGETWIDVLEFEAFYSAFADDEGRSPIVTHWMPLPMPPKGDE